MRNPFALTLALCLLNISGLAGAARNPDPALLPLPQVDRAPCSHARQRLLATKPGEKCGVTAKYTNHCHGFSVNVRLSGR